MSRDEPAETERLAWRVLRTVNRVQAKGSTVRLVVPRAPEVADELDPPLAEEEILASEEYLLDQDYLAPAEVGIPHGAFTLTPAGLDWLEKGPPEPPEPVEEAAEDPEPDSQPAPDEPEPPPVRDLP